MEDAKTKPAYLAFAGTEYPDYRGTAAVLVARSEESLLMLMDALATRDVDDMHGAMPKGYGSYEVCQWHFSQKEIYAGREILELPAHWWPVIDHIKARAQRADLWDTVKLRLETILCLRDGSGPSKLAELPIKYQINPEYADSEFYKPIDWWRPVGMSLKEFYSAYPRLADPLS